MFATKLIVFLVAALVAVSLPPIEAYINIIRLDFPPPFSQAKCTSLAAPLEACWDRRAKGPYPAGSTHAVYYNLSVTTLQMWYLLAACMFIIFAGLQSALTALVKRRARYLFVAAVFISTVPVLFSHVALWHYLNDGSRDMIYSQFFFTFTEDLSYLILMAHCDRRRPTPTGPLGLMVSVALFHLVQMVSDELATSGQSALWRLLRNSHLLAGDLAVLAAGGRTLWPRHGVRLPVLVCTGVLFVIFHRGGFTDAASATIGA